MHLVDSSGSRETDDDIGIPRRTALRHAWCPDHRALVADVHVFSAAGIGAANDATRAYVAMGDKNPLYRCLVIRHWTSVRIELAEELVDNPLGRCVYGDLVTSHVVFPLRRQHETARRAHHTAVATVDGKLKNRTHS